MDLTSKIIYQSDFLNRSNEWENWITSNENRKRYIQNGNFCIEIFDRSLSYVKKGIILGDFEAQIEVCISNNSAPSTCAGIIFRVQKYGNNRSNFHAFWINLKGKFALSTQIGGEWIRWITPTFSSAIKNDDSTNLLKVKYVGNKIELYINDILVGKLNDDRWKTGDIGFIAQVPFLGGYGETFFRNFRIYEIKEFSDSIDDICKRILKNEELDLFDIDLFKQGLKKRLINTINVDMLHEIAFSSDGQRIMGLENNGTFSQWEVTSGKRLSSLELGNFGISAISFSNDGNYFVGARDTSDNVIIGNVEENKVVVFDTKDLGSSWWTQGSPLCMNNSSAFIIKHNGNHEKKICKIDIQTGNSIDLLLENFSRLDLDHMVASSNGKGLVVWASGTFGGVWVDEDSMEPEYEINSVLSIDTDSGEIFQLFKETYDIQKHAVTETLISTDCNGLIPECRGKFPIFSNLPETDISKVFEQIDTIRHIVFSTDGKHALFDSDSKFSHHGRDFNSKDQISIMDIGTGKSLELPYLWMSENYHKHRDYCVKDYKLSPDGKLAAVLSIEGIINIWDLSESLSRL